MLFNNTIFPAGGGFTYLYEIDNSVKFSAADSDTIYLSRGATPTCTSYTKGVLSTWVKKIGQASYQSIHSSYSSGTVYSWVYFNNDDTLKGTYLNSTTKWMFTTDAVFRDPTQWYHIYVKLDTTQTTDTDRIVVYVNGKKQTFSTATYPTKDGGYGFFNVENLYTFVGGYNNSNYFLDGYQAEHHVFDGSTPDVTEFGRLKYNTWVPKKYAGSEAYGNLGMYLDFSDESDLGKDISGNDIDLSSENGSPIQSLDTPTNNFPIFDALIPTAETITLAGTKLTTTNATQWGKTLTATIPSTGVWQVEFELDAGSNARCSCGVTCVDDRLWTERLDYDGYQYYGYNGELYNDGSGTTFGATFAATDIIDVVANMDTGYVYWYKNNSLQGSQAIDTSKVWSFSAGDLTTSYGGNWILHNGSEGFTYDISGAQPICTSNILKNMLTIVNSSQGLYIDTYTGDGGATRTFTGYSFNLTNGCMLVVKNRSDDIENILYDTTRGLPYSLSLSEYWREYTDTDDGLSSFTSDGWTHMYDSYNDDMNKNGDDYVAWAWALGKKFGIEIVLYDGNGTENRQINHNLGVVPEMIWVKNRDDNSWGWWAGCSYLHATTPWAYYFDLHYNDVIAAEKENAWYDTAPTETNFTVSYLDSDSTNDNGDEYFAVLFTSVPGFSKIGYYTGNANANGPRIYTGFRPKWVMVKSVAATSSIVWDSERNTYNPVDNTIFIDSHLAEVDGTYPIDFLSNGFKIRDTDAGLNATGVRHIYMAFAEAPYPFCNGA